MTDKWGDKFFGSPQHPSSDTNGSDTEQPATITKEQVVNACKLISKIMDLSDSMELLARDATDCHRSDLANYFRDVSHFCVTQARLMYLPLERTENWRQKIPKPEVPEKPNSL